MVIYFKVNGVDGIRHFSDFEIAKEKLSKELNIEKENIEVREALKEDIDLYIFKKAVKF